MITDLPHGRAALNPSWPDARWNISGLFVRDRVIYDLIVLMKERFKCDLNIDSVHGAPRVPWNSGRISSVDVLPPDQIAKGAKLFNDLGIGIYFTFTNHLLAQEDLADTTCNQLLDAIDNSTGLNGVILCSDLLHDYLRQTHPNLKLTASIVKVAMENGRGNLAYYKQQTDRFDSVMLHPDDAFKLDLLDQLDRDKTEVIVNENCVLNCAIRKQHYDLMAAQQIAGPSTGPTELSDHETNKCQMPLQKLDGSKRSCNLAVDELKAIYDMGFTRLKLQGRGDSPSCFLFDLTRYMLEPDYVMPVVLKGFFGGWTKPNKENYRNHPQ